VAARKQGRFRGCDIDICLRRWRSLTHALGFRIFYRVKLCLDGIPEHAWMPVIVERVIGHQCALQTIVTDQGNRGAHYRPPVCSTNHHHRPGAARGH
jgi:hypothetical protein